MEEVDMGSDSWSNDGTLPGDQAMVNSPALIDDVPVAGGLRYVPQKIP